MKKTFLLIVLVVMTTGQLLAQSPLKLDPEQLYKADKQFTVNDWAGFYQTSLNKEILFFVPGNEGEVKGFYTNIYCGKWVEREGFTGDIRIFDKHGKMVNKDGVLVGQINGKLDGNGINFTWDEIVIGQYENETGPGFMVMRDNKEDIFAKIGLDSMKGVHVFGLKNTALYSMVKKRAIEIEPGTINLPLSAWIGRYKLGTTDSLILHEYGTGVMGFYTLKGYKSSMISSGVWYRETVPDRYVVVMGYPVGNKLYCLTTNYTDRVIYTVIFELSSDGKSITAQEAKWDMFGAKWKGSFTAKRE
jgi:hypothetical protein